jgi:hypothetical protein
VTGDQAMPERRMWAAVLETAVRDTLRPMPEDEPGSYRNVTRWRQDRAYIKTADFSDICLLAGFEAEYVRKHVIAKMVED